MRLAVLTVILLGLAAPAQAQDPVAMDHQGQPGVWLPLDLAREALAAYQDRERFRLLDAQLRLAVAEADQLRLALTSSRLAERAMRRSVDASLASQEAAERGRQAAEDDLAVWYRSPFLWAAVGLLVGGGGVLAAVLAL